MRSPFGTGSGIFYAVLLPGLVGLIVTGGRRRRSVHLLSLILVLGCSTLWMASCSNQVSGANKDPGTPAGTYTVNVNATTGGANPLTATLPITLTVTAK